MGLQGCTTMLSFYLLRLGWGSHELFIAQADLKLQSSRSQPPVLFGTAGMPLHPAIGWDWVSQTFCSGWPQTLILPISASQVIRITGVSHECPALSTFLMPAVCPLHKWDNLECLQMLLNVPCRANHPWLRIVGLSEEPKRPHFRAWRRSFQGTSVVCQPLLSPLTIPNGPGPA
jgi:hypothetical protein